MTVELKAIVPSGPVVPDLDKIIAIAIKDAAGDVLENYQKTTRTWKKGDIFSSDIQPDEAIVGTSSKIYQYVDEGTEPHDIAPVRATALAFNGTFSPKTRPRVVDSVRGVSAPPVRFAKSVRHPGTKARQFTKTIVRRVSPRFQKRLQRAIDAEVKKQQLTAKRGQL